MSRMKNNDTRPGMNWRINALVIGGVLLLIAVVVLVSGLQKRNIDPTLGPLTMDPTVPPVASATAAAVPAPTAASASEVAATEIAATNLPEAAESPAIAAYLVVSVGGQMYEPIPLSQSGYFTVRQGEETYNIIGVTPDSIWMEASSCENQDCVDQGIVSLENRDTRPLQGWVICLPNQVTLELYTAEEIAELTRTVGEADHE